MLAEAIVQVYSNNKYVLGLNAEGLTHEESLLNPQAAGNNFNWILSHILAGRVEALDHLGGTPVWDEEQRARYVSGSAAITPETALALSDLLAALDESQDRLMAALSHGEVATFLDQPYDDGGTVGQRLLGLHGTRPTMPDKPIT